MIHCKHLRLSDANKLTYLRYLLTYRRRMLPVLRTRILVMEPRLDWLEPRAARVMTAIIRSLSLILDLAKVLGEISPKRCLKYPD